MIEFDFNLDDVTVTVTNYVNLIWTLSAITVLLYEYKLCRHILLLSLFLIYLALSTSPSVTLSIPLRQYNHYFYFIIYIVFPIIRTWCD